MDVFRSKQFWSAVVGLIVLVISAFIPALAEQLNIIAPSVVVVIGLLIGGFTAEGVAETQAQARIATAKAESSR